MHIHGGEVDVESKDSSGREAFNGIFGDRFVSLRKPKFSANFNYPTDTRLYKSTLANGGTAGIVTNLLTVQTSIAVDGSAIFETKDNLRYSAGRDAELMFTLIFSTPKADSYQRAGLFDAQDGFYFGFEGIDFGVTVRKGASNIFTKQADFSNDKLDGTGLSKFVYDPTKINIFRLTYGYLGIAPAFYQIYGGAELGWITFHIHDVVNEQAVTHISKPYLPVRYEVANTGNNTNMTISSGSLYAGVIDGAGAVDASSREFTKTKSAVAASAGTNQLIMFFHNKATYGGVTNKIGDLLLKVGMGVESNKPVLLSLYKVPVAPVGAVWTDVDLANSNMETSILGTVTLVGAQALDSWAIGKSGSINVDTRNFNYLLLPDEYAVFVYSAAGAVDYDFTNRWSELF